MNAFEIINKLDSRTKSILDIIQRFGPLTKNDILIKSKLKLSTLNRDMSELEELKLISSVSIADSTGGRKPTLYDVTRGGYYLIGIDISRTYTQIVVSNLKFETLLEDRVQSDSYSMSQTIIDLPNLIQNLLRRSQLNVRNFIGIGVGIVHGTDQSMIKTQLETAFDLPIFIDNGANAAVICENHIGSGKGKQNVAYIHCGVGIRTGVISSGVLIRSINNSEDALGHMVIISNNADVDCEDQGCLESLISINAISDKYNRVIKNTNLTKNDYALSFEEICNLAEAGDATSRKIITEAAHDFSVGLTNFVRLLNPQLVILSGPLIQYSSLFYNESTRLTEINLRTLSSNLSFNSGSFELNSIAIGAVVMTYLEAINGN